MGGLPRRRSPLGFRFALRGSAQAGKRQACRSIRTCGGGLCACSRSLRPLPIFRPRGEDTLACLRPGASPADLPRAGACLQWQGYISDSLARIGGSEGSTDVLVALHACDTATDDAICSGIRAGARVIIVAPCCHKELRGQMDGAGGQKAGGVLQDVFAHGILAGRMSETATDAIRAMVLQIMGYRTQVFEFIDGVHTAKNIMITAIKKSSGDELTARQESEEAGRTAALRRRLADLMSFFGIGVQRLAMLVGENPESDNPRYLHQVWHRPLVRPACLPLPRSLSPSGVSHMPQGRARRLPMVRLGRYAN